MGMLVVEGINVERDGVLLLRDVSFRLDKGEILAILGVNGTGKSTLAYTLMGIYPVKSGRILLDGEDITTMTISERARRGMTLAWQEPARFEGITVEKYLSISCNGCGSERIGEALRAVGLNPELYMKRAVDHRLSGGERKRIELASVLLMDPKVAILDEPDSGIDMAAYDMIVSAVRNMKQHGTSVILITHNAKILSIADRAALMCNRTLIATGSAAEISKYFEKECEPCGIHDFRIKEEG